MARLLKLIQWTKEFLFADDVVLLSDCPEDPRCISNVVHTWCVENKMNINVDKSGIVHQKNPSVGRRDSVFTGGYLIIENASQLKYFDHVLPELLNYPVTVKCLAQAAGRAFGLF